MTKIPSVEELIKSLPKHYSNVRCSEDNPMVPLSSVKQALQAQRDAGYRQFLLEIKHEQRKLLDGFGHPKDCAMCLTQPTK